MQTELADFIRDSAEGREAEAILRKCVHCGFCTATCPTYQVLGDDLDSPRGRIYLMKRMLEGGPVSARTRLHLDRCLTCRACETTCPSGVQYGRLVDIGRAVVEERVPRAPWDRLKRAFLSFFLPRTSLFGAALALGRLVGMKLPSRRDPGRWPVARHSRKMLALAGCVQPAIAPSINAAAARVLDAVGISLVEAPGAGCCGALRFHLNRQDEGRDDMRALIDAWWPLVERGEVEAIVMTASGCGATVKEYGHLLAALSRRTDPLLLDGEREARCVVHAEGSAAEAREKRYAQDALVARLRTRPASSGTAYERFTPEGPLALLPLDDGYAVVWSCSPQRAAELLASSDASFLEALRRAAGSRPGDPVEVSERSVQPLVLRVHPARIAERAVYIGNAAQTLHPVAGQGLNLGLRDAWDLASALREAHDPGDARVLARFAARRRLDAQATIRITDALAGAFLGSSRVLRAARGAALTALDVLPAPRRVFARRMIFGPSALP